ncbi:hypothetical protein [Candidatus Vidania fulgoroideorum]
MRHIPVMFFDIIKEIKKKCFIDTTLGLGNYNEYLNFLYNNNVCYSFEIDRKYSLFNKQNFNKNFNNVNKVLTCNKKVKMLTIDLGRSINQEKARFTNTVDLNGFLFKIIKMFKGFGKISILIFNSNENKCFNFFNKNINVFIKRKKNICLEGELNKNPCSKNSVNYILKFI